jgi:hypothetical protein
MRRTPTRVPPLIVLSTASWPATGVRVVVGAVVGLVAGLAVTLGVVVARARFEGHYIESTADLMSPQALPIVLGLAVGVAVGLSGWRVLAASAAGVLAGAAAGVAAGALLGGATSSEPESRWAGAVMGGAAGVALGLVLGVVSARRRRRAGPSLRKRHPSAAATAAVLAVAGLTPGCAREPVPLETSQEVPSETAPAESVILLVGDPGKARFKHYPIFQRLAAEVERWSIRIGRDSAVTVVMLGDIVYPDGMHPPDSDPYEQDSARVADQLDIVRAAGSVAHGSRLLFVAGNHDWGLKEDREGARRLRNLGSFLERARTRGIEVDLLPPAGSGAPHAVDIGDHLRLILLDTAWWLFDAEPGGKEAMIEGVAVGIADAGDREVVIVAHHPYESAGPHGGTVPVWRTLGIQYLLNRSGAMLQDINSRPYADLRRALSTVFQRVGRPLLFAGGHEHSLQVLRHDDPGAPRFSVVSGSASKLTPVRPIPGTLFQAAVPGYMALVTRTDGAVDLYAEGAPERYLKCPEDEPEALEWEVCMERGVESFETLFATRLVDPEE